jgi:hypothetical protein
MGRLLYIFDKHFMHMMISIMHMLALLSFMHMQVKVYVYDSKALGVC